MRLNPAIQLMTALLWTSAPALADPATPVESHKLRPPPDPNQKICEDLTTVGSRIATKRVCATRAEWAEKRKQDKEEVDRIQRSPCITTEGTSTCDHGG